MLLTYRAINSRDFSFLLLSWKNPSNFDKIGLAFHYINKWLTKIASKDFFIFIFLYSQPKLSATGIDEIGVLLDSLYETAGQATGL